MVASAIAGRQEGATNHPFMVLPGASRAQGTRGLGGEISLKVSGKDTSGVWAFFEIPYQPTCRPTTTSPP